MRGTEGGLEKVPVQPGAELAGGPGHALAGVCQLALRVVGARLQAVFADEQGPVPVDGEDQPFELLRAVFGPVVLLVHAEAERVADLRRAEAGLLGLEQAFLGECGAVLKVHAADQGVGFLIVAGGRQLSGPAQLPGREDQPHDQKNEQHTGRRGQQKAELCVLFCAFFHPGLPRHW